MLLLLDNSIVPCHAIHTWLSDIVAAVAGVSWQVVQHTAVALLAAEAEAAASKGVHNEDELAQQGLQEPELRTHMLQAVLHSNDGRYGVQPADGSLCAGQQNCKASGPVWR